MTKKTAKKLIAELQKEVNTTNVREQFWMDKVQGYTQAIFGDSTQSIALPMFGTYYFGDRDYSNWDETKIKFRIDRLTELFKVYQIMIDNGVYVRKNVFQNFTDPQIFLGVIGIIIAIALFVGTLSYEAGECIGVSSMECKLMDCKNDNLKLEKQLSFKKIENEKRQDSYRDTNSFNKQRKK